MKQAIFGLMMAFVMAFTFTGCGAEDGSNSDGTSGIEIPENAVGIYVEISGNPKRVADGSTDAIAINKNDFAIYRDTIITDSSSSVKMILVNMTSIAVAPSSEFYLKEVAEPEDEESPVLTATNKHVISAASSGIAAMRFSGEIKGAIRVEDNIEDSGNVVTDALKDGFKTVAGYIGRIKLENGCENFNKTFTIGIRGTQFDIYGGSCEIPSMINVTDGSIDATEMLLADSPYGTEDENLYDGTTNTLNTGEMVTVAVSGTVTKAVTDATYATALDAFFETNDAAEEVINDNNTDTSAFDTRIPLEYTYNVFSYDDGGYNGDGRSLYVIQYEDWIEIEYYNTNDNVSFTVETTVNTDGTFSVEYNGYIVSGSTSPSLGGSVTVEINNDSELFFDSFSGTLVEN